MKRLLVTAGLVFLFALCLAYVDPIIANSPTDNFWVTKTSGPISVGSKSAVVNGKIYVMSGSFNYEYDPTADNWTAKAPMPTSRLYFGMAVYQNKIYVIGGRYDITYSTNEVYDPSNNSWQTKQSMPIGGSDLDANVVNGRIYLIWQNHNEVYDIKNDSWSVGKVMSYPVIAYASAVFDDKIYIFGGHGSSNSSDRQTQIYDPVLNSWSIGTLSPTAVSNAAAAATTGVLAPKRIYVLGGDGYGGIEGISLNQVYNPENDAWVLGAPMPTARHALTVAVVNDTLYAFGGFENIFYSTNANEQYTPIGYGTIPRVSVISPANSVYNETKVPLTFTVDRPYTWIRYSLDGQHNITAAGNTTLIGLPSGMHKVTVYANDTFGNVGASQTVNFTIVVPTITIMNLFSTVTVAVVSGVVVVFVVGIFFLLLFRKHRKITKLN